MKEIYVFLLILIIATSSIAQEEKIHSFLNIKDLKTDSLKLIINKLTDSWLESYIDTSEEVLALTDYKILNIGHPFFYDDSVDTVSWDSTKMNFNKLMDGETMIATITFSVKPKTKNFPWRAGNGRWEEETGWVNRKSLYLSIRKNEDKIVLYKMGTSL